VSTRGGSSNIGSTGDPVITSDDGDDFPADSVEASASVRRSCPRPISSLA
jgi:hypothetical protein